MPRSKVILQSEFPYNISARCINREWFQLPMQKVWNIFCEELSRTSKDNQLKIHSFVLMTNHFHLIASTPRANISRCMHQFMHHSSLRLAKAGNRINETFAGRHHKTILHEINYYFNAYKYNYRNPVASGICSRVEEYPFSTLYALVGKSKLLFPLEEDLTFQSTPQETLKWLNTKPDPIKTEAVKQALKKQYFEYKKDRILRKPLLDEKEVI